MSWSNLELLPIDVLQDLLEYLDLATKALVARCSKALRDAIGVETYHQLQQDREARRKFFLLLEKDLPTDCFFCPGCIAFHSHLPHRVGITNPCVKVDVRKMVHEYYGQDFHFYQARFALRLYSRQDPRADSYLRTLEASQETPSDRDCQFWSRKLRIAAADKDRTPHLFLRMQHWCLLSAREIDESRLVIKGRKLGCPRYSTVQVCGHERDTRRRLYSHLLRPFHLGLLKPSETVWEMQQHPGPGSHCHWHTNLHHCMICATEYRMDIFHLPDESPPPQNHDILPLWAIVVTKWMDLGTLDTQCGEWKAHAYAERATGLSHSVSKLHPGSAFNVFEKEIVSSDDLRKLEYKPCWSKDLETKVMSQFALTEGFKQCNESVNFIKRNLGPVYYSTSNDFSDDG